MLSSRSLPTSRVKILHVELDPALAVPLAVFKMAGQIDPLRQIVQQIAAPEGDGLSHHRPIADAQFEVLAFRAHPAPVNDLHVPDGKQRWAVGFAGGFQPAHTNRHGVSLDASWPE